MDNYKHKDGIYECIEGGAMWGGDSDKLGYCVLRPRVGERVKVESTKIEEVLDYTLLRIRITNLNTGEYVYSYINSLVWMASSGVSNRLRRISQNTEDEEIL
jgi:hypothetical protein